MFDRIEMLGGEFGSIIYDRLWIDCSRLVEPST